MIACGVYFIQASFLVLIFIEGANNFRGHWKLPCSQSLPIDGLHAVSTFQKQIRGFCFSGGLVSHIPPRRISLDGMISTLKCISNQNHVPPLRPAESSRASAGQVTSRGRGLDRKRGGEWGVETGLRSLKCMPRSCHASGSARF